MEFIAKCKKKRPLYTKYSLYTLSSNDKFSHDKASRELGYRPRDLYETIRDTIAWLKRQKIPLARLTGGRPFSPLRRGFFCPTAARGEGTRRKTLPQTKRNRFSYFPVKDKAATYRGVF